jgi:8-oxo-dGTP pyrophosphatase MutT (NUDIX family)
MTTGTLCLLLDNDRVLLAMKKRGFGVGKWNGFGGKVKPDETIEGAALRELEEEAGVRARSEHLEKVGYIRFHSDYTDDLKWEVHIFALRNWKGEPRESEEMRPQWFSHDEIPFDAMWPDDKHWLPPVLAGKKIEAEFHFNKAVDGFDRFDLRELPD